MGKAGQGRPAKPSSLKLLHGESRPSRLNMHEPKPTAADVQPPQWLVDAHSETPVGQESALDVWNRLAPDLIAKQVLTNWDIECLAIYADAVVRYREATRDVAREGVTIQGHRGSVKNPAVTAAKDYADLVQRFGARLGLTPSDRASLSVKGDESDGKSAGRLIG